MILSLLLLLASPSWAGIAITQATVIGDLSIESGKLRNGAVDSEKLAKNSVDSEKTVSGSIGNNHIVNLTIQSGKLAQSSVDSEKLANGSVGNVHIVNLTIDSRKLAANSVDSEKIVDGAVDTNNLATDSVTSDAIINAAISTAKLAADAVTTTAIKGGSVTNSKLGLTTRTCAGGNAVTSLSATDDITCSAFGSSSLGGSGTNGTIAKWNGAGGLTLGDSIITESGAQVTVAGTGKLTNSAGAQLSVGGWNSRTGANASSSEARFGGATYFGALQYNYGNNAEIILANNYPGTSAGIEFKTRCDLGAACLPALTIAGTGVVTSTNNFIIGGSADGVGVGLQVATSFYVYNNGSISAPSQPGARACMMAENPPMGVQSIYAPVFWSTATGAGSGLNYNRNSTIDIHASSSAFRARGAGIYMVSGQVWLQTTSVTALNLAIVSTGGNYAVTPYGNVGSVSKVFAFPSAAINLGDGDSVNFAIYMEGTSLTYGTNACNYNFAGIQKLW